MKLSTLFYQLLVLSLVSVRTIDAESIVAQVTTKLGFFQEVTPQAPADHDVINLLARTAEWYEQNLGAELSTLLSFDARFMSISFDPLGEYPITIAYDMNASFEDGTTPTLEEFLAVLQNMDLQEYIYNAVWTPDQSGGVFDDIQSIYYHSKNARKVSGEVAAPPCDGVLAVPAGQCDEECFPNLTCEECPFGYNDGCNDCECGERGGCNEIFCSFRGIPYCLRDCTDVECAQPRCEEGVESVVLPGDCCPTCVVQFNCMIPRPPTPAPTTAPPTTEAATACAHALAAYSEKASGYTTIDVNCLTAPTCGASPVLFGGTKEIACNFTETSSRNDFANCVETNTTSVDDLGVALTFSAKVSPEPFVGTVSHNDWTADWGITPGCNGDDRVYLLLRNSEYGGLFNVVGHGDMEDFLAGAFINGNGMVKAEAISGIDNDTGSCAYGWQYSVELAGSCRLN